MAAESNHRLARMEERQKNIELMVLSIIAGAVAVQAAGQEVGNNGDDGGSEADAEVDAGLQVSSPPAPFPEDLFATMELLHLIKAWYSPKRVLRRAPGGRL
jgi:hypothetical protein